MAMKLRVPPSGRDFDAYVRVTVEEQSTRQVARELGISQTRVCQIVERVGKYLLKVTPACLSAEDVGRQCNLAKQIAAARVEFMYGQAVRDYEASKGMQTVTREVNAEGRPRTTIKTTKMNFGEVKLMDRAVKYAMLGAKLPVPNLASLLPDEEDAEDTTQSDTQGAEDDEILTAEIVNDPLEEACSPADAEQDVEEEDDELDDDESDEDDESSDYLTPEEEAEFRAAAQKYFTVQLREELLKKGYPADQADEILHGPLGEKLIEDCHAAVGAEV